MRAVPVSIAIALLAGSALADPDPLRDRTAAAIRTEDVAALSELIMQTDEVVRDRMLDVLVVRKRLDARTRAVFPTRQTIARHLAKLGPAKTGTRAPLAIETCRLIGGTGGQFTIECGERGCDGACGVVRREATIRVQAGRWSVIGTNVKPLADTGECGCCM